MWICHHFTLILILLSSINWCFTATVQDHLKVLHCVIDNIGKGYEMCKIKKQDVDTKGFTIATVEVQNVKSLNFLFNKKVEFLPEHLSNHFPTNCQPIRSITVVLKALTAIISITCMNSLN